MGDVRGNTTGPANGRSVNRTPSPLDQFYNWTTDTYNSAFNSKKGTSSFTSTRPETLPSQTVIATFDKTSSGGYSFISDPSIITSLKDAKYKSAPLFLRHNGVEDSTISGLLSPSAYAANKSSYVWVGQPISYVDKKGVRHSYSGYYSALTDTPPPIKPPTNPIDTTNGSTSNADGKKPKPAKPSNPLDYSWNLPPHKWSLPTQIKQSFSLGDENSTTKDVYSGGSTPRTATNDMYRRGRLWHNFSAGDISILDANGNTKSVKATQSGKNYGFQFLWNPEQFSTSVSVQMDTTPTANDRFIGGAGAFPATETISFTVHLDRTNDFACAYGMMKRPGLDNGKWNNSFISESDIPASLLEYYKTGFFSSGNGLSSINKKLADLFMRGTVADVEYLYLAINGYGPGAKDNKGHDIAWINGRGGKSADIGFLQPTLLNIDIGPLSYRGYVTNLSVTHTAFTEQMIPIRSDVNISLNILATAGISGSSA